PDMFLGPDGKPLPFPDAVASGRSGGVPGLLRLFQLPHGVHGRLPWGRPSDPAIALAERGFAMSPRLLALVAGYPRLAEAPAARALYFDGDGKPKAVGTRIVNPAFADTLRRIAASGADAFYSGEIAADVAGAV